MKKIIQVILPIVFINIQGFSQTLTKLDYQKALWMTTRFYGAQRSGDNNWVLYNHLPAGVASNLRGKAFIADADGSTDLSGGWHDCGDHVKFGQTQFYSAYILLKGYAEFKTGYDDKYSFEYQGYKTANKWNFEDNAHDPNCIPDVLDEMKHETDFLIKCTPNATTFYYQVGQGGPDHKIWETAVKMQTETVANGGEPRVVYKNPNDASMASFCGATLALMSRMYKKFDPAYAATCLTHAVYAYTYAKNHPGTAGAGDRGFYGANTSWKDDYATLCTELYFATGTVSYKTEALSYESQITINTAWALDYGNNEEIAIYNLALLGSTTAKTTFNNRINSGYINGNRNGSGLFTGGNASWGALRYNAIASFLISLYSKLNNDVSSATINAICKDIDYIMGSNSSKRSYIVGFTPSATGYIAPQKPHHRNVYLRDDNPPNADNTLTIPSKNQQLGALVGGKRDGSYTDDRSDYANSEVCIDYNAGLVGALGFINSRLAPVDTNKICVNAPPDVPQVVGPATANVGETNTYSVTAVSGTNFVWTVTGDVQIVSGQGTSALVVKFNGGNATISVLATNSYGSTTSPSKVVTVQSVTGILSSLHQLVNIYPNPFNSAFTLNLSSLSGNVFVKVYDLKSNLLVGQKEVDSGSEITLGGDYPPGFYIVEVISENVNYKYKLVKQ
ncbi:MAG: glycoside hydrolase family 9 protein [Sporocytophaga sp.]|uniref:glycoside hydrolase family 9 protein n=1 Tax=Sporocytophaga sp. TaxID=2231183 RepID=UPI001B188D82|nr:glycoside hydrolase family 9 protein [Sporocytophaga sp.]MBO9698753.1 glycoside hydrolase family 9 protein [Sporocytophaga sp.]